MCIQSVLIIVDESIGFDEDVGYVGEESVEIHAADEGAAVNVVEGISAAIEGANGVSPVCAELYNVALIPLS